MLPGEDGEGVRESRAGSFRTSWSNSRVGFCCLGILLRVESVKVVHDVEVVLAAELGYLNELWGQLRF